mmetsp:Transcript_28921/g.67912  ORF Transcript_28921/g.67912 Transcript_28921/m.67912 type:complete len:233 (-) Transcript_28921:268-966(-)
MLWAVLAIQEFRGVRVTNGRQVDVLGAQRIENSRKRSHGKDGVVHETKFVKGIDLQVCNGIAPQTGIVSIVDEISRFQRDLSALDPGDNGSDFLHDWFDDFLAPEWCRQHDVINPLREAFHLGPQCNDVSPGARSGGNYQSPPLLGVAGRRGDRTLVEGRTLLDSRTSRTHEGFRSGFPVSSGSRTIATLRRRRRRRRQSFRIVPEDRFPANVPFFPLLGCVVVGQPRLIGL